MWGVLPSRKSSYLLTEDVSNRDKAVEGVSSIMGISMRAEAALLRFHLRVGVRLALRILAPVLAAILLLYYLLRPEFMVALARALFIEGSLVESGLAGSLLLFGMARAVTRRITAGRAGWAGSLPADGRVLRGLEILSSIVAEAPLLAVLGAFASAVASPRPERIALHLAGLLVGAAAAGFFYIQGPTSRPRKVLPAAACFLSFAGNGILLTAAAAILAMALAAPMDIAGPRMRLRRRRSLPPARFFYGLSLRAVGYRIVSVTVPPAIILAACRLSLMNNDLPPKTVFSLSLLGLSLALAVFIGLASDALSARRPVWPWLRSLPLSAAARIGSDSLFLGLNALPVIASGLALLGRPAWEAAFLAGPLAWLAIRAAGVIREAGDRPFGVLGRIFMEGAMISVGMAVLPWISWLLALAAPGAFLSARTAERRLKATLWAERHHLSAGDPLSWRAS
jgi:hypothetical protein